MKILIIISSLRSGGAEHAVAKLYDSFDLRGHEVMVATFSRSNVDYPVDHLIELGIEASNNILNKFVNIIRRAIQVRKIKRSFNPDVSIGFLFGPNLVNILTRYKKELVISSVRSALRQKDYKSLIGFVSSLVYIKSDLIVAVSKGVKSQLIQRYKIQESKIKVVYNFIDIQVDLNPRDSIQNEVKIITIGRLEMVKGHWHLIYLLKELINLNLNASLTILGEGSLRGDLEALIQLLDLHNRVHLLGFQNDINSHLNEADIFCFSSSHEGFPNVILEAMSAGLPIISTEVPHGPKEIINPSEVALYCNDEIKYENKYGLLVDYGDNTKSEQIGYFDKYIVGQFVNKVQLLINCQSLYNYYSRQSLKRALDFSEEKRFNDWLEILEKNT
jgi:N-acetylgalactosamine-N,N'-diacetylbacillosaminyl-diphospho-undecaprenol 4-alpha-N-acetylgalactosaminyltransferase